MAFDVRADQQTNRIYITLSGFATIEDVTAFGRELEHAVGRLQSYRGPHQMLYDVSEAKIQSQDVVQALRELALQSPRTSAFALVNASALAGRQLSRIFDGIPVEVCRNHAEAAQWLDAQVSR